MFSSALVLVAMFTVPSPTFPPTHPQQPQDAINVAFDPEDAGSCKGDKCAGGGSYSVQQA